MGKSFKIRKSSKENVRRQTTNVFPSIVSGPGGISLVLDPFAGRMDSTDQDVLGDLISDDRD